MKILSRRNSIDLKNKNFLFVNEYHSEVEKKNGRALNNLQQYGCTDEKSKLLTPKKKTSWFVLLIFSPFIFSRSCRIEIKINREKDRKIQYVNISGRFSSSSMGWFSRMNNNNRMQSFQRMIRTIILLIITIIILLFDHVQQHGKQSNHLLFEC